MATSVLERKLILRRMLTDSGYTDRLVAENFPIWAPRKPVSFPDFVSFVRPDQRTMATAAIVAPVVDSEREVRDLWLSSAAAIAAPVALIALPEHVSLWSIGANVEDSRQIADTDISSYGRLTDRLASLSPEAVEKFKSAGIQPPLFPLDITLLEHSRRESRSYLTQLVENAMRTAQVYGSNSKESPPPRLVIAAIAALMIQDKLGPPSLDTESLISHVENDFHGYFGWVSTLDIRDARVLRRLIDELRSEVNFSSLEPSMVSDVYEQALVTPTQRRAQGTYYTPPPLAHQLLEMVPIESLPPNHRSILDPACGSGTLLLAGSARLEQLQPPATSLIDMHGYLTENLRGYDQDPFAVEISKINLLMSALPASNSWRVEPRDVLKLKLTNQYKPWIVVSNPPWQYSRAEGSQNERANEFLSWIIETLQPGGFLACVLPVTWLNSRTSRRHRERLLDDCTVLEAWRLPEATFASSAAAPSVIIAQKTAGGHPPGRVMLGKRITSRPGSLQRFYDTGIPDNAYLTDPGRNAFGFLGGSLSQQLSKRNDLVPLKEAVQIHSGCPHNPERPHRTPADSTHRELSSASYLRAFGVVDPALLDYVRYPDDFHHVNKSDENVSRIKVLVPAKRWTENPWRIKAGLDLVGVVPRETFYMVLPKPEWPLWNGLEEVEQLYSLLAILGSGLAASLIDELEPRRNISSETYRSIPVPGSPVALRELVGAGENIVQAVRSNNPKIIERAAIDLENIVARVYGLPTEAMEAIQQSLGGYPAPEGIMRYEKPSAEQNFQRQSYAVPSFGTVLDATPDGIKVWVSGVTDPDGQLIPTPLRAPGWICQAGVDFTISEDLSRLSTARFGLHLHDWLADDRPILPVEEEVESL